MAIEHDDRILLIDCGLMFPDADMHGIDLVLPDFTWLRENADRIEGCVVTHGHEDHVGALQYLLRDLSFPIYGSALALGFARHRIEEAGLLGRTEADPGARRRARARSGRSTSSSSRSRTRSRTRTPSRCTRRRACMLHSGDFKLDLTPVDGRLTDLGRIGAIASTVGHPAAARRLARTPRSTGTRRARPSVGACCVSCSRSTPAGGSSPPASPATSTASSRSATPRSPRAASSRRMGLSMKKNVRLGRELGILTIPEASLDRHRGGRQLPAGQGLHHLDRFAGRADVGAVAARRAARTSSSRSAITTP